MKWEPGSLSRAGRGRGEVTLMLSWLPLPSSSLSSHRISSRSCGAYSQLLSLAPHFRYLEDFCPCGWGEAAADEWGLISVSSEWRVVVGWPCPGLPGLSGVWGNLPHLMSVRKGWVDRLGGVNLVLWLQKAIGRLTPPTSAAVFQRCAGSYVAIRESPAGFLEEGQWEGLNSLTLGSLEPELKENESQASYEALALAMTGQLRSWAAPNYLQTINERSNEVEKTELRDLILLTFNLMSWKSFQGNIRKKIKIKISG